MNSIIFKLIIVTIFVFPISVFSQTEFYPAKTIDIKLYGGKTSGSSFYDMESSIKTELPDIQLGNEEEERNFIFDYNEYIYGIKGEYAVTNNLVLFSDIPIKYYTLHERTDTTLYDSSGNEYPQKIDRADFSLLQPAYLSLGARYKLYSKLAYAAISGEIRIPPGFHNGIQNDPDYQFLSDGALEFHSGLILGVKFEKGWLESSIAYHYRAEDLVDNLFIHTEGGISTVPGSKLMAYIDFTQSFGTFNNAVQFNPRYTTLQEDIFDIGFLFQLFVTDHLYGEFSYKINLLGKNTWNLGGFIIAAGVRI